MGSNYKFLLCVIDFGKNVKNQFSKDFFKENWLIIEDYEYRPTFIYIIEIKVENFYSCGILEAKQFLPTPPC